MPRTSCSRCQSFSPKYARPADAICRSLRTTVRTASMPGPMNAFERVRGRSRSRGIDSRPDGATIPGRRTKSALSLRSVSRSVCTVLGYCARSAGSSNCVGLTKILTNVRSFSARLRLTSDRCPSCSAPIVGTKPRLNPARIWRRRPMRHADRLSKTVVTCSFPRRLEIAVL